MRRPLQAHYIRNDRHELDVGILESFPKALNVLRNLACQLRPRPCQVAKVLNWGWRRKARPDQAARQQVGDPDRVIDVALAAGNIADVRSIRERKLEPALQNVPDRLPVDACRLHRHVRDAVPSQPIRQLQKIARRR